MQREGRVRRVMATIASAAMCLASTSPSRAETDLQFSYQSLAGDPPLVTTLAWFDWFEQLRSARESLCVFPRKHSFHFSPDGDDIKGDGSLALPWRSLAKARAVLDQHPEGGVSLLFERGGEWRDSTGLDLTAPGSHVGAWGQGPAPLISAFTIQLPAGSHQWADLAGGSWALVLDQTIGWVRLDGGDLQRLAPLSWARTPAEAFTRDYAWHQDPVWKVLYIQLPPGIDPNTLSFEATGIVLDDGIMAAGDGTLVEDIRCDGWGANAGRADQFYGIKVSPTGEATVMVRRCESYYQGRHGISMLDTSVEPGGYALFEDCVTGYVNRTAARANLFNSYSSGAGHESIFLRCHARFGVLPDYQSAGVDDSVAEAFYGHIGSFEEEPPFRAGLYIVKDCEVSSELDIPRATWARATAHFDGSHLPDVDSLDDVRAFIVGLHAQIDGPSRGQFVVAEGNAVVNMSLDYLNLQEPQSCQMPFESGGWMINSRVQWQGDTGSIRAIFNPVRPCNAVILHSEFQVAVPVIDSIFHAMQFMGSGSNAGVTLVNSIVTNETQQPLVIPPGARGGRLDANEFYGAIDRPQGAGLESILEPAAELSCLPEFITMAGACLGQQLPGIPVEYDLDGTPRPGDSISIGPWNRFVDTDVLLRAAECAMLTGGNGWLPAGLDTNGDGGLDSADLFPPAPNTADR